MQEITYKVEKSKEDEKKWLVVRYSMSKRTNGVGAFSCGKVFEGKKQECIDFKKRKEEE